MSSYKYHYYITYSFDNGHGWAGIIRDSKIDNFEKIKSLSITIAKDAGITKIVIENIILINKEKISIAEAKENLNDANKAGVGEKYHA